MVARYLHRRFVYHKERREDEAVKLLQLLEGKTKKESARLFYEILVCSICILELFLCVSLSIGFVCSSLQNLHFLFGNIYIHIYTIDLNFFSNEKIPYSAILLCYSR